MRDLYEIAKDIALYRCVKTVVYNPYHNYIVVYFRKGTHETMDIIADIVRKNKNVIISLLHDRRMMIIRERVIK